MVVMPSGAAFYYDIYLDAVYGLYCLNRNQYC